MVEEARGRTGFHVEMDWSGLFKVDPELAYAIPAALAMPRRIDEQLGRHIVSQGFKLYFQVLAVTRSWVAFQLLSRNSREPPR